MHNNPTKTLFLLTLMGGTMISMSSNSWLGAWMGLEINLLSFIPLMLNSKNLFSTEASLKYFLIQAIASATLLFSVILMFLITEMSTLMENEILSMLVSSSLFMKMGAAPFHFWFPGVMEGLSWLNCLLLMTWQKIAPLILLSYCLKLNLFTSIIITLSVIIGSLGGLNQTSLRKLLAYSSINHLGWMIAAMSTSENLWFNYFLIYSFLSTCLVFSFNFLQTFHINQLFLTLNKSPWIKFSVLLFFLSLGGLPPFLGFFPKWIVIQTLTEHNIIFITTFMVVTTLLTLFYYLRITFSAIILSYSELKWMPKTFLNSSQSSLILVLATTSILGLSLSTILFYTL
uniref:NADH-ubiquinone oxidoreductase chain 2 n=1 Tax=Ceuthophilus sp. TaxID=3073481 RepID=A0AAU7BAC9_9ORTH